MLIFKRVILAAITFIATVMFFFLVQIFYTCPFKAIFGIPCPGCGLTRAFKCVLRFKMIKALEYHLLSWPIFLIVLSSFILLLMCILLDKNFFAFLEKIKLNKAQYFILFALVMISWITNIIRGV